MQRFIISIFLVGFSLLIFAQEERTNILVIGEGAAWSEPELQEIKNYFQGNRINFSWIDGNNIDWTHNALRGYDIIWLHKNDSILSYSFEDNPEYYSCLLNYAENGGSILLTQHALDFVNHSGLEPVQVEHRSKESMDNGYGRMLGFHSFIHHALFDSLHGGAYIWKPPFDTTVSQCGFFNDAVPQNGKVVAVDWDYIFVRENSKLIVEYEQGNGTILGIGAYFNLFEPNLNRMHYDVFYKNVFDYLVGKKHADKHYWLYGAYNIKPMEFILERAIIPPEAKKWEIKENPIALGREKAQNEYCEVAGRRMLVAAYEPGGIFEVWAHPFMAFREYKIDLLVEGDTIHLPDDILPSIEVTPESVKRIYSLGRNVVLREILAVSPDKPLGVVHYEYEGPEAAIIIHYKSNMRLMWPYSEKVLKTLNYAYQPGLNAIEFNAPEAKLVTFVGANKIPVLYETYRTNDTLFEVAASQTYMLGSDDELDIVFAAGNEGRDSIVQEYLRALADPQAIYKKSVQHYEDLFDTMLMITTPDENFNKGYRWALAATDRFFVTTPGLGTSLVAGYNGTDRGWDGGHAVNGRPGYAWYFGRDAVWSAFALLDYGDYKGVKDILNMFVKYQDLNGKIFHELSTSGFVHYDASDATPLFIILAGRYFEYSHDTAYIRNIWPAIKKAMEYCESTDTDGDGLIENTNVGHGWVEGGHLFGSHTSLYLASCWAEACGSYSIIARSLNSDIHSMYSDKYQSIRQYLQDSFYNEESGYMYQGIYSDGTYHTEQSILPAVGMYLLGDYQLNRHAWQVETMLNDFASHKYTSDWGLRMTSIYNENYHPRAYHSGAVWPLYTGWVALAEFLNGRPLQGFSHTLMNLNNYLDFSLGYTEEVLNGEKYDPAGVCPHQCWSQTMVIQPIIEGILGKHGDFNLFFAPVFPPTWNAVEVKNIKCINGSFDFKMERNADKTTFTFSDINDFTPVAFNPVFMPGTEIDELIFNGVKRKNEDSWTTMRGVPKTFWFHDDGKVVLKHHGGISVIPPSEKAIPGQKSAGIRIINDIWQDNTYTIEVEGAPAMKYELEVINNFGTPKSVDGASFTEEGNRLFLQVDFPALNRSYSKKKISIGF